MKRFLPHALVFSVGFGLSFAIRTSIEADKAIAAGKAKYRAGYVDGRESVQREAVVCGHAHYERDDASDRNLFAWNPLPHYAGDVTREMRD